MENLTDKQIKFIDTYLNTSTITETCKKLKISRTTAYNYLNDEQVKAEISKRKSELINDTTYYLQSNLRTCSEVLMDIIQSEESSPQVKINAINSMFNNCNKMTETNDILVKLTDIEQKLAEREADIV